MALISFGEKPQRVTGAGAASTQQVLDLGLYFASMTLLLKVFVLKDTGSTPSFQVTMETAMDPDGDWVSLGAFAALAATGAKKGTFTDLLRYVRWNVTTATNVTEAYFTLTGVARTP